jgi:hypothetical protein
MIHHKVIDRHLMELMLLHNLRLKMHLIHIKWRHHWKLFNKIYMLIWRKHIDSMILYHAHHRDSHILIIKIIL